MKRMLFISHRVPFPPDKGERVRAFHEIQALAGHFQITVATLAHDAGDYDSAQRLKDHCHDVLIAPAGGRAGLVKGAVSLLRGRSVTEGYFHSRSLYRLLRRLADRERFDLVMAYCSSMSGYARAVPADARVMDLVDVDSAKWLEYARTARRPKRWLYRLEGRRVAQLERDALEHFNAVLVVSENETRAISADTDRLIALPNGVDVDYFTPADEPPESAPSLVFTGTMDYRPNVEGVCWFVSQVWPALRRQVPELTFTIVGRDPTPAVRRLDRQAGVTVTGSVPDVRPYFAAATCAVVPLQIARGIQNKVLEAMAAGRAVVATGAALEGIEVERGLDVIQADTVEQWTRQVPLLVQDAAARRRLQEAGRQCVEDKYSWGARMAPLVALCRRLTESSERQAT